MKAKLKDKMEKGRGAAHIGSRPMVVHVDSRGTEWLCDKNVNGGDFAAQGCWRTDMMAFNRND